MNYFKPTTYYYIIPILKIDSGIKLVFDDNTTDDITLHHYVNEKFPILKELDKERVDICYNDPLWKIDRSSAREKHSKQIRLIDEGIDFLGLPKHILARGNDSEVIEPVTGTRIINSSELHSSLRSYRVSDCDLYQYDIYNYEDKITSFFNPDESLLQLSHQSKTDFVRELEYSKVGIKVKNLK